MENISPTSWQWEQQGSWFIHNGPKLFTLSIGQGSPLLMLHAFPTSSYDYSRLAPYLQNDFRLILFDYPGFGFSDKPRPHRYSLFEYADCLQAVAAHYAIERATLIAHDIGCSVALELLKRGSPIIEKLVLINGSVLSIPFDNPLWAAAQRAMISPLLGPLIGRLRLVNRLAFGRMFSPLFSRPLTIDEMDAFWSLVTFNDGRAIYPALMQYMPERWQHQRQWLEALRNHSAPLTLIWGQADPVATPAVAHHVMSIRPDARYVKLDGVGHYPHWEVPQEVARIIPMALS
jgi:pimeloyl-ACP methyl ester carboxylesterase